MARHREIPGMYFDEQRGRYFAIPSSRKIADFNSPEIKKLDQQIKNVKRQKLLQKPPKLTKIEQEVLKKKECQTIEDTELQNLKEHIRIRGVAGPSIQTIIDEYTAALSSKRRLQFSKLYSLYMPANRERTGGFTILETPDDVSEYTIAVYDEYCNDLKYIVSNNFNLTFDIIDFSLTPKMYSLIPNDNGGKNFYADGPSGLVLNIDPKLLVNNIRPCFLFDRSACITKMSHKNNYVLHRISPETFEISKMNLNTTSEITVVAKLGTIVSYGCRNGKVGILDLKNPKAVIVIDFGNAICSVALLTKNDRQYCVISGQKDSLRSYLFDLTLNIFKIDRVFDGYLWSARVSNNMKHDNNTEGIFGIESECDDPTMLEVKFFSLSCTRPLQMISGPFRISNVNTSQHLWNIWKQTIIFYDQQTQKFVLYKDLSLNGLFT